MGEQLGLSKSTVDRHIRAQQRRNQHPESSFWDTEAGSAWLARLVFATLYQFGVKNQMGASQLSEFFRLIRIDTHVGISENSLRQQLRKMEALFPDYQQQCKSSATPPAAGRTVAMDETFFQQMMILVMVDLPSNYILLEKPAADRSFVTWQAAAHDRLASMQLTVRHAISDRAKALIKLALDEFGCAAGADLFHALYDLSRWLSGSLARATQKASMYRQEAQSLLDKEMARGNKRDDREIGRLTAYVTDAEKQLNACTTAQQTHQQHREAISRSIHPFNLSSGVPQDETAILATLKQESDDLETLAKTRGIKDPKNKLRKFRRQHETLSQHVSTWWVWVHALLADLDTDKPLRNWVTHRLMPVVYWHCHAKKTKKPDDRRLYRAAWKTAVEAFDDDAITQSLPPETVEHWLQWCEDKITHFQRTSSAVEGRNGCLSQMYHNRRGLTEPRLTALTVIHNYGMFRADGSTPANRLYGQDFPDLFEWLLSEMGALPLPRKRRQKKKPNPLIYVECPALSG